MLYVDPLVDYGQAALDRGLPSRTWCHLLADTEPELHAAAQQLGLRRSWYQSKGPADPAWHYDLTPGKRAQAVNKLGAQEVDRAAVADLIDRRRAATRKQNQAVPGLLVWRDQRHYDHRGDRPCVLCGKPTALRSHKDEPAHKVCAEAWNADHPGETRYVSDAAPRTRREAA
jgi:hypothetical protein